MNVSVLEYILLAQPYGTLWMIIVMQQLKLKKFKNK